MILHVDIDAFFASVEQVLNPCLRGKPVVVGGCAGDRGVVASASYEARARGVRTAMPLARARRLCPEATFLPGRFEHYHRFSVRVMDILRDFSPAVEVASLDEAYLDAVGCERLFGPPIEMAQRIRQRIRRETGLGVSIGIGSSRLVAKVATALAKPGGIAEVFAGFEREFLEVLPLEALPGIGLRTAERLRALFGLRTIGDLQRIPEEVLKEIFGLHGEALYRHCRGEAPSSLDTNLRPPRSVSRTTTFERDTADLAYVEAMLHYLTERAAREVRQHRLLARRVAVTLRYADFHTVSRSRTLPQPTDQDARLYRESVDLLRRLYSRREAVRLVGVHLEGLVPADQHQMDLFEEPHYRKWARLYRAIDRVRDRFGFGALVTGRSIDLLPVMERNREGFLLHTPCLSR